MSVDEQMGYGIRCDFPGCDITTRDIGEYSFWGSIADAVEEWRDSDGISDEGGQFCETHTVWVEDENGDEERVGMPYTLDNLFMLAEQRIARRIDEMERWALMRLGDRCRHAASRASASHRHGVTRLISEGVLERVPF